MNRRPFHYPMNRPIADPARMPITLGDEWHPVATAYAAAVASASGTITAADLAVINREVNRLYHTSAWAKIRELWIPAGNELTAARVKLKTAASASFTVTNLTSGDYTRTGGIYTGGTNTNKRLNSDFTPSTSGATAGAEMFGIYSLSATWTGSLGGSSSSGTYVRYENGGSYLGGYSRTAPTGKGLGIGLRSVQSSGGQLQCWHGGFMQVQSASAAAHPSGTIQILANAGSNFCTAAIGGYVFADALTAEEHVAVSRCMDACNLGFGRTIRRTGVLNVAGDSVVRGYLVAAGERFSAVAAAALSLTEINDGYDGIAMAPEATGAPGVWSSDLISSYGTWTHAEHLVISMGVNDLTTGVTAAQYEAAYRVALEKISAARLGSMANVMLATPFWVNLADGYLGNYTAAKHAAFADIVLALAAEYRTKSVDLYRGSLANQTDKFNPDNIHPTAAGHALLAADLVAAF